MFESVTQNGVFLGLKGNCGRAFYFFGSRFVGPDDLRRLFPQYQFCAVQQVHGRGVLHVEKAFEAANLPEADALHTTTPGLAIVVKTADCVPILLSDDNQVCAVHAGWRGVANRILAAVQQNHPSFSPTQAWIGPHIQMNSFEVGADVAQQLLAATPAEARGEWTTHVDLNKIVRAQLRALYGDRPPRVDSCDIDTVTDPRFHSFRRDRESSGRQYSFVVLNP